MLKSYGNYIDAARDPRRQPPVQLEDISTRNSQHEHADDFSIVVPTNSPSRDASTDETPIPSTPDRLHENLTSGASPATSISPSPKSTAAEMVALMRKVPVRKVSSPEKKGSSDKKPQKKPAGQHVKLDISEQKTDSGQPEHPMPQRLRSLHMDTQLRDSELEVECVRGEGSILVRHHQEKSLQEAHLYREAFRCERTPPQNGCWDQSYARNRSSLSTASHAARQAIP